MNYSEFNANQYPLTNGTRLIEASAGTGKTFSLAHLILRLIVEKDYKINEILVVSFTEATASEIKSKIVKRLVKTLRILEHNKKVYKSEEIDSVLSEWIINHNKSNKLRLKASNLILKALQNIDNADITTIHGFCSKTLKRETIAAGTAIDTEIETNSHEIITQIVYQYWEDNVIELNFNHLQGLINAGFYPKKIIDAIIKIDSDTNNNISTMSTFTNLKGSLAEEFEQLVDSYWFNFSDNWQSEGQNLELIFRELAKEWRANGLANTKPYSPKPKKNRYEILNNWVLKFMDNKENNISQKTPFFNEIREQNLIPEYFHPKNLWKIKNNSGLKIETDIKPLLQKSIINIYDSPLEIVWSHSINYCLKELQERRLSKGLLSYSDLLRSLDPGKTSNLNDISYDPTKSEIIKNLRNRYKVALIDEFQDTDQSQWRLLQKTFAISNEHLLLMVGDPKQAIYRFRGGDLETYIAAREKVERIDCLRSNFRTTSSLMKSLNSLFSIGLIKSKLEIPYLKACSKEEELLSSDDSYPLKVLNVVSKENGKDKQSVLPKYKLEAQIPVIVKNYLTDLLNKYPEDIKPSDICVLVNRHDQAEDIRAALSLGRIPSKLINKGNIFTSQGAYALQLFINCLANPSDPNHLRLLTCSSLMQWDIKHLNQAETNGELDQLYNNFHKISKLQPKIGILGCLSELLKGKDIAELSTKGKLLSDIYQCAQLLQEQIYLQGLDAYGASNWLKRQRLQPKEPIPDDHLPNSDLEDNAVNIITIHRSKGLQFNFVICPYLWQKPPSTKGPLWKRKNDWVISSTNEWYKDKNLAEEEEKASLEEAERIAYVAMTRAKSQLTLIWGAALKQEGNPLSNLLFGPKAIDLKIECHTTELMKEWKETNNLEISIDNVEYKEINTNTSWQKVQNKLNINEKLSIGLTPKGSLNNAWGRYSYSLWVSSLYKNKAKFPSPDETEIYHDDIELNTGADSEINDQNMPKETKGEWSKEAPLMNFPRGAISGSCLHRIFERIDFEESPYEASTAKIIKEELRRSGIDSKFLKPVQEAIERVLNLELNICHSNFTLKNLRTNLRISELNFDLPISNKGEPIKSLVIANAFKKDPDKNYGGSYVNKINNLNFYSQGFLTGAIDLVFPDNSDLEVAKWWVIDWKSNWIGINKVDRTNNTCGPYHYSNSAMTKLMINHHYPLQAHIYLLALHKFLSWRLPNYSPEKHLGGYLYVFLRGIPSEKEIIERGKDQYIPGLIIENAPIGRIEELDKIICKEGKW